MAWRKLFQRRNLPCTLTLLRHSSNCLAIAAASSERFSIGLLGDEDVAGFANLLAPSSNLAVSINRCQRKYHFRIRLDPNSSCATPSRPYPRIIDLAGAISGSPSPLQLNRRRNAVVGEFVH